MSRRYIAVGLSLGFFLSPSFAKTAKPADSAKVHAEAFETAWVKTKFLKADFTQTIEVTGEDPEVTHGKIWVRKPDHIRWEEEAATTRSIQILKGADFFIGTERKRKPGPFHWESYRKGASRFDKNALAFFSDSAPIGKSYRIEPGKETKEILILNLKPKHGLGDSLIAEMSKDSYLLRALSVISPESRCRIEFANVKVGEDISREMKDELFEPAIRKGIDTVTEN